MIPLFKVAMSPKAAINVAKVLEPDANGNIYCGEGPLVKEFESKFHNLQGTKVKPLMVNSGTSAISLALSLCDVGPGDWVVSTAITCLASNLPILQLGAHVHWADVINGTGLINPNSVKKCISKKTKAIIAVDWAGEYCDYNELKKFGIPVIQDAAHCLTIDPNNCGDYICFSTQAIKYLTTGDGGFLITPEEKYEEARLRRWFGLDRESSADFRCAQNVQYVGYKYQATDIDAAIGLANIDLAVANQKKQRENALYYDKKLTQPATISRKPKITPNHQCWLYTLFIEERGDSSKNSKKFISDMKNLGISCSKVHSRNDTHDVFKNYQKYLYCTQSFDNSQVSIPVGWWLTDAERDHIVYSVKSWRP